MSYIHMFLLNRAYCSFSLFSTDIYRTDIFVLVVFYLVMNGELESLCNVFKLYILIFFF